MRTLRIYSQQLSHTVKQLYHILKWVAFPFSELPWWLRRWSVCLQCRRPAFDPWVGKILWRRKWQSTPVLLPGKSHGRGSLVGYSLWGCKESDMTERLHFTSLPFPSLLQGIFPTQEWNPGLLHCRQIPYQLNYQGNPHILHTAVLITFIML